MNNENTARVAVTRWDYSQPTQSYSVSIALTAEQFETLRTEASDEVVDLSLESAELASHALALATDPSAVLLETVDGETYLADILDPNESTGLTTFALR